MDAGAKLLILVCLFVLSLSVWAQDIEPLTDEKKDGAQYRALVALLQFRKTEKSYTGKNATRTTHAPEEICCINGMYGSKHEMLYSKLDPKVRQRLEAVPGINKPFDIVRTVEALRAINQPPVGKK